MHRHCMHVCLFVQIISMSHPSTYYKLMKYNLFRTWSPWFLFAPIKSFSLGSFLVSSFLYLSLVYHSYAPLHLFSVSLLSFISSPFSLSLSFCLSFYLLFSAFLSISLLEVHNFYSNLHLHSLPFVFFSLSIFHFPFFFPFSHFSLSFSLFSEVTGVSATLCHSLGQRQTSVTHCLCLHWAQVTTHISSILSPHFMGTTCSLCPLMSALIPAIITLALNGRQSAPTITVSASLILTQTLHGLLFE